MRGRLAHPRETSARREGEIEEQQELPRSRGLDRDRHVAGVVERAVAGDVDRLERHDGNRLPAVLHIEVLSGQPGHGLAGPIGHEDRHGDEDRFAAEHRRRRLLVGCLPGEARVDGGQQAESGSVAGAPSRSVAHSRDLGCSGQGAS